jgi:hypothetical protein
MQQAKPLEFLSVNDACTAACIGRTKLYSLLTEGHITARKMGTRTLIEASSLQKWAASLPVATFASSKIEPKFANQIRDLVND